jgi:hypothetical protein
LSEKWFQRGLWLIALVFAGFMVGLGRLVVGDLPLVEKPVDPESFMDRSQLLKSRAQLHADDAVLKSNQEALDRVNLAVETARDKTNSAHDTYTNWIATRSATQQSSQDAEVIKRTRELDELKAQERSAEEQQERLEQERLTLQQSKTAVQAQEQSVEDAGREGYDRAVRKLELRVFLLRLAVIMPLLLLSILLFFRARKSAYWPFVWGFIFFSLFAFFVELVPYLPSYGGYVRYIVGIVLTVFAGVYAIRSLQRYLEQQKVAEEKPEEQRRKDLGYDVALVRLAKKVCPGCERPFETADPLNNFCVHCGLLVFHECLVCKVRQTVFTHFCRACGATHSASGQQTSSASSATN